MCGYCAEYITARTLAGLYIKQIVCERPEGSDLTSRGIESPVQRAAGVRMTDTEATGHKSDTGREEGLMVPCSVL